MVARQMKERSSSPNLNLRVELDNRALKAKNSTLTQSVAKLQQENAELLKQFSLLQAENFEINSKFNNLKNVISIIDSTTKTFLPKLNEFVETFTGIMQLCSVAANISSFDIISPPSRDMRTQAVKPQIVNGHILHNPTITLSRLSNPNNTDTPPRPNRSNVELIGPSTSSSSTESNEDRSRVSNGNQEDDGDNNMEGQDSSFVCQANRRSHRKPSGNFDMSIFQAEDFDNSDEENEEPVEEDEISNGVQSDPRLTTIHEMDEEEELLSSISPRSRQQRFLNGRLQEVRIYLNQLPNTCIEQFLHSGNISISVSPPERRSSFKHRSSSLVGEANESVMDSERSYLEEQLNRSRMSRGECPLNESSRINDNAAKLNVTYKSPIRASVQSFENSSNSSNNISDQFPGNLSSIHSLQTPSTIIRNETSPNDTNTIFSESLQGSTPLAPRLSDGSMDRSDLYVNLSRSKNDSLIFRTNITKRKPISTGRRKVAQVLLNRLSTERTSSSPIKAFEDIVNMPPIRKSSELKTQQKNRTATNNSNEKNGNMNEENVGKKENGKAGSKRKKRDSPTMKAGSIVKPRLQKTVSPTKSPAGRPKRAARPKTLKEPTLNKKMRRSK